MAIALEGVTRSGNRTRLTDCFNQLFSDVCVDDQQKWQLAEKVALARYGRLPDDIAGCLDVIVSRIMRLKEELLELALAAGSAEICRSCGGECCLFGKYHVSVLDLLAYRIDRSEAVVPDFNSAPHCPYGGIDGCRMPPRFRPLTCVIFNCDAVEQRIGEDGRTRFAAAEQELRDAVRQAETLLGFRASRALLLSCDE